MSLDVCGIRAAALAMSNSAYKEASNIFEAAGTRIRTSALRTQEAIASRNLDRQQDSRGTSRRRSAIWTA